VQRRGNDLYHDYLEVAREMIEQITARAGFQLMGWKGYHCGHSSDMTHYWARLARSAARAAAA
jgi:hypothetical protein